jgi:hypothetical protein
LKIKDTNDVLVWLRTIDERLRAKRLTSFEDLDGEPVCSLNPTNMDGPVVPISTIVHGSKKKITVSRLFADNCALLIP